MEQEKSRSKADTLAYLRGQIQKMEGYKPENRSESVSFGIPEMDDAFPAGTFPLGAVHEFISNGHEDTAATLGFSSAIFASIAEKGGAILWITKTRSVFPPGLRIYGLDPEKIIFVELSRDKEVLWAMEEGLRTKGLAVVVGEVSDADLTATRRLQLAVEESGVTGFLMRIDPRKTGTSSCFTTWKIESIPSQFDNGMPGIAFPCWKVALLKVRNGTPKEWRVEWKGKKFHLVRETLIKSPREKPFLQVAR